MRWLSRATRSVAAATAVAVGCVGTAVPATAALTPERAALEHPDTLLLSAPPAPADPTTATGPGTYIVTLAEPPAAAYDGGVPGLRPTSPRHGERFDRSRPAVAAYTSWLLERQDALLERIGDPDPLYRFTTAVNGFVAELTTEQVKQLRTSGGVLLVERSTTHHLDSVDSPDLLGVDATWQQLGGARDAGDGVVIGLVDSGVWPENPSFTALPTSGAALRRSLPGFHGTCREADQWSEEDCNRKLVAARWFVAGFGEENIAQAEYLSPRDARGHGSHVASTAAGNHGVAVEIGDQELGTASGMAPGARIAAYKACWIAPDPADDGCATPDLVAAVDRAVADGVDVLGFPVSGSPHTLADSLALAFLNAAAGGVFVATSAGNDGPAAGTVSHPSPWVTTVAASTHRLFQGSLELGDGTSYVGAMVSDRTVAGPLVLASDAAADHATLDEAATCALGSLSAEAVDGGIVVCDRGVVPRVEKSETVARAGGAGMVLLNTQPRGREADVHAVPTVHLDLNAATAVKTYLAEAPDPRAVLDPTGADDTAVPAAAEFSGRGPSPAASGDILKPDLSAPGVSVVGAVAPPSNDNRLWDLQSGTSASVGHVAGLAALLLAEHPRWSPARVKSAMMTTAADLERGDHPFHQGAGLVQPSRFLEPGLVYDTEPGAWWRLLAGQGLTHTDGAPLAARPLRDASELNLPSIAVGDLVGSTAVTRTVTNVTGERTTFTVSTSSLDGVTMRVRPQSLTLRPGESAQYTVRFETEPTAPMDIFTTGTLTWSSAEAGTLTSIPVAVRPHQVRVPDEISVTGGSGEITVEGRSGFTEQLEPSVIGPAPAAPAAVTLAPGSFDPTAPVADEDTLLTPVTVPAGTEVARFEVVADDLADDLDLFLFRTDGTVRSPVARSTSASGSEQITLVDPEPGQYELFVNAASAGDAATASGALYVWTLTAADSGTLVASPGILDLQVGDPFELRIAWGASAGPDLPGLDTTQRWLGQVRYGDTGQRTLVSVG